jgi:hypothetical protein
MKAPKPPKLPAVIPPPPPVSAAATDVSAASRDAKQRDKKNYGFDKTIYRAGGMSSLPPGTSPTLGK